MPERRPLWVSRLLTVTHTYAPQPCHTGISYMHVNTRRGGRGPHSAGLMPAMAGSAGATPRPLPARRAASSAQSTGC